MRPGTERQTYCYFCCRCCYHHHHHHHHHHSCAGDKRDITKPKNVIVRLALFTAVSIEHIPVLRHAKLRSLADRHLPASLSRQPLYTRQPARTCKCATRIPRTPPRFESKLRLGKFRVVCRPFWVLIKLTTCHDHFTPPLCTFDYTGFFNPTPFELQIIRFTCITEQCRGTESADSHNLNKMFILSSRNIRRYRKWWTPFPAL